MKILHILSKYNREGDGPISKRPTTAVFVLLCVNVYIPCVWVCGCVRERKKGR